MMDFMQRSLALNGLAKISLQIDVNNNWYVFQAAEIGGDGFLTCECGRGKTPEEAINNHWNILTNLPLDRHIYLSSSKKRVRWNGFMWEEIPGKEA